MREGAHFRPDVLATSRWMLHILLSALNFLKRPARDRTARRHGASSIFLPKVAFSPNVSMRTPFGRRVSSTCVLVLLPRVAALD